MGCDAAEPTEPERLTDFLRRDAAAPDLGRLAATADALAGPFALKWRLADETRPGLRLGISLWLRLCVVVSHDFLDLGYGGVDAAHPRDTKKTATNSVTVRIPARWDKRSERGLERLGRCGLGLLEQVLRGPGRQIEELLRTLSTITAAGRSGVAA